MRAYGKRTFDANLFVPHEQCEQTIAHMSGAGINLSYYLVVHEVYTFSQNFIYIIMISYYRTVF